MGTNFQERFRFMGSHPWIGAGAPWQRFRRTGRSGWVWRMSLLLAGLVVAVPVLLLVLGLLLAVLVFVIAFTLLGWIDGVIGWFRGSRGDRGYGGAGSAEPSPRDRVVTIEPDDVRRVD